MDVHPRHRLFRCGRRRAGAHGAHALVIVGAVAALASSTVRVSAQGYAGTPPVPAPVGAFPTVVASTTVSGSGPTTLAGSGTSVLVPAGALPSGTQVSILAGDTVTLQHLLPAGQILVAGYAVGWIAPDGSTPLAKSPLTFTIASSAIQSGEAAYETTSTGLVPAAATITAGQAMFTFSADPGFVVANTAVTALANSTPAPVPAGPGNAGGGAAASTFPTPLQASMLLVGASLMALVGTILFRRRRAA